MAFTIAWVASVDNSVELFTNGATSRAEVLGNPVSFVYFFVGHRGSLIFIP